MEWGQLFSGGHTMGDLSKAMARFWGATSQLESGTTHDAIWVLLPLQVRSRNLGRAYESVGVKRSQR